MTATIIPFSNQLKIRNLDAMARGVNAPYLEVIEGLEENEYVAKQWRRQLPQSGIVVSFPKTGRKL